MPEKVTRYCPLEGKLDMFPVYLFLFTIVCNHCDTLDVASFTSNHLEIR